MRRTVYANERYAYLCQLRDLRAMTRVNAINTTKERHTLQRLLAGIRKHRERTA